MTPRPTSCTPRARAGTHRAAAVVISSLSLDGASAQLRSVRSLQARGQGAHVQMPGRRLLLEVGAS